ncbi:MAG: glycosyltransferase family 39 protein [Candidatus Methanoperedens sp.]|nr:glycosyltransferase family 39 protein [Candidatus Methanoperedens sp.]
MTSGKSDTGKKMPEPQIQDLQVILDRATKNKYILGVVLLFLLSALSDYIWLRLETEPPGWDEALHLTKSLQYYNILTNPGSDMISNLIQVDNYYPPFYHFSTVLTYFLFGTSMHAAISINIFYFGILLFSVYGIGKSLYNSETGLISVVLISLYPGIVGIRRFYLIEIALVATVALSVYLLLLSDHFKNRKYSIGFGIAFAISILTKWTAVFFIIGPLAFILYESFIKNGYFFKKSMKNKCTYCGKEIINKEITYEKGLFCSSNCKNLWKKEQKKHINNRSNPGINFLLMGAAALLLSLIWYAPHLSEVYKTIAWGNEYWGTTEGDPEVFTFQSIIFYTIALINSQISFLLFIVFLAGLIIAPRSRLKSNYLLLSWIILPYIVMTLLRNKNDRYTIASIAAVAIISAFWIASLNSKKTKAIIVSIIIVAGGFQLLTLAKGIDLASDLRIKTAVGNVDLYSAGSYGTRPPVTQDWKVEEALDSIMADARTNPRMYGRAGYIGIVPDMAFTNGLTFGYYSYMKKLPFNVISVPYFEALEPFKQNFLNFDYLIFKSGENSGDSRKKLVSDMYDYFNQHNSSYTLIGKFTLPDESELSVYRNIFIPNAK